MVKARLGQIRSTSKPPMKTELDNLNRGNRVTKIMRFNGLVAYSENKAPFTPKP